MLAISRRVIATVVALVAAGGAPVAIAATDNALYRTHKQAERYLTRDMHRWEGIDLRKFPTKTAYCVGADRGSGHRHVDRDGETVYHSFSCVLNVTIASGKYGTRVFQLDLVRERHSWDITSDSG